MASWTDADDLRMRREMSHALAELNDVDPADWEPSLSNEEWDEHQGSDVLLAAMRIINQLQGDVLRLEQESKAPVEFVEVHDKSLRAKIEAANLDGYVTMLRELADNLDVIEQASYDG